MLPQKSNLGFTEFTHCHDCEIAEVSRADMEWPCIGPWSAVEVIKCMFLEDTEVFMHSEGRTCAEILPKHGLHCKV